jgi:hypothetical protein
MRTRRAQALYLPRSINTLSSLFFGKKNEEEGGERKKKEGR